MNYNIIYEKWLLHSLGEYEELDKIIKWEYKKEEFKYIVLLDEKSDINDFIEISNKNNKLFIILENKLLSVIRKWKKINPIDIRIYKEFENLSKIFIYQDFKYYFSFDNNFIRFFIEKIEDSFEWSDSVSGWTEWFSIVSNNSWCYILYEDWSLSEKFDSYTKTPPSRNDTTDSPLYVMKNWLHNIVWINGKLLSNTFLPYIFWSKKCTKRGDESRRAYTTYLSDIQLNKSNSSEIKKNFLDKYFLKN